MVHLRFRFLVLATAGLMMAVASPANAEALTKAALKNKVTGRMVMLNTGYGITLPIRYRSNGTMSAKSESIAKYVGYSQDKGRWWVRGDRLCQRWNKWLSGKTSCFKLKISGKKITWTSNSGTTGTARITN